MNKITRKTFVFLATLAFAVLASTAALAAAANFQLFGDSVLTSPGYNSVTAAQIRSDGTIAPNYGGVDFVIPAGLIVNDLDTLSADYKFVAGGCGGGSPRFQVNVVTPAGTKNIFVYLGAAPNYNVCALNVWANTLNLASGTNQVDTAQLVGGGPYMTYAAAQAAYGAYEITGIQIVADGSWAVGGTQTVHVDNVKINSLTYSFETANSCKNDGWQQFVSAPGPFTNQGQCVSYFAKGGQ